MKTAYQDRSPDDKEDIRINRERASSKNPFSGKNYIQRLRLQRAFTDMASRYQRMGLQ